MLKSYVPWYKLVKEPEEFVNLLLRKVGIVAGVLNFKSVGVFAFPGHYVRQRIQAGVANGDTDSIVPVLLQELHQNRFAIESSLTPSSKLDFINFLKSRFPPQSSLPKELKKLLDLVGNSKLR